MTKPSDSPIESTKELHESKERKPEDLSPFRKALNQLGVTMTEFGRRKFSSLTEQVRYQDEVCIPAYAEVLRIYEEAAQPRVGLSRGAEPEMPTKPIVVINTRDDYEWAMAEIEELVDLDPAADSFFGRELLRLTALVREYEKLPPRGEAETPTDTQRLDYVERTSEEDVFHWPTEHSDEEITLRQAIDRRMAEETRYERSYQAHLASKKERPNAD